MNFLVPKSMQNCAPPESVIKSLFVTIQFHSFLNDFKISDVDQLILALIFRLGVILV